VKIGDFGLARETRSQPPYTDYVSTRWYVCVCVCAVASPGFVARRGKADFRAGCSSSLMTNIFVTGAVLIERAASC